MWITNEENRPIDYYVDKTWIIFKPRERKDLDESLAIGIMEKLPYWRFQLDKKDIAYITKTADAVTIVLKSGRKIVQRKPEELAFLRIEKKMDHKKIQIAIFMKNIITHYSGGRYWAWLLGNILSEDSRVQVTFITNQNPPFGESFNCYNSKDIFIYTDNPKNIYRMGDRISKNAFDCILGIPIEGGMSAQVYAGKWAMKYFCLLFESPNFIREYRKGPDSEDISWRPYISVMQCAEKVINNTEIGKDYLDVWMAKGFEKNKSVWLWNSINTKVADKVSQKENTKTGEYHLIFVGRMIEFKRTIHIIRALNLIKNKKFIVHILSGRAGTIVSRMQGEALPHVKIEFHQRVDDYEKFRLIKLSNMMVFLSSFEGFGMPPMEALYCKRLCIAYPLPILKLVYKDNLIYAKNGDVNGLSKVINEWLTHPKKDKFITKAKAYIDGIADHDRVRREFFEITGLDKFEKKIDKQSSPAIVTDKNSRLSFGIIVCNGAQFILQQLKHIYDMADEIVICEGAVDIFDKLIGSFYSTDKTLDLIREFKEIKDPINKIKLFTSKKLGRSWKDKMEMQNCIAENTKADYFIKQDVDEFYDLKALAKEISRLEKEKGRIMINYKSYHFWGDFKHIVKGGNFNDKQTRVWKWNPAFRYVKTFNWITDTNSGKYTPPEPGNTLTSEDSLFHYNYIYGNKQRLNVLKYYTLRKLGDHKDVHRAWVNKNPDFLEGGRHVEAVDLTHPVSDEVLKEFMK